MKHVIPLWPSKASKQTLGCLTVKTDLMAYKGILLGRWRETPYQVPDIRKKSYSDGSEALE